LTPHISCRFGMVGGACRSGATVSKLSRAVLHRRCSRRALVDFQQFARDQLVDVGRTGTGAQRAISRFALRPTRSRQDRSAGRPLSIRNIISRRRRPDGRARNSPCAFLWIVAGRRDCARVGRTISRSHRRGDRLRFALRIHPNQHQTMGRANRYGQGWRYSGNRRAHAATLVSTGCLCCQSAGRCQSARDGALDPCVYRKPY
jgi:hypothetical protein